MGRAAVAPAVLDLEGAVNQSLDGSGFASLSTIGAPS